MDIVSLAPSNTEIVYRLGMEECLIATTSLCDYPEEAVKKPSVGGWSEGVKADKVIDLNPDLVLASDDLQDQIVKGLENEGLDVLQVRPHTVEDVFDSVRVIGDKLGKPNRAEQIVEEMINELSDIDLREKRIYCEEWMDPPMVSGNWIPRFVEKCNGSYFIEEGSRSREFDLEELKEFDPEYIFLNVCGAGENIDTSKVLERDDWQGIAAVEKGNIFVVDDALLNRPSPRVVRGLKEMEKRIV